MSFLSVSGVLPVALGVASANCRRDTHRMAQIPLNPRNWVVTVRSAGSLRSLDHSLFVLRFVSILVVQCLVVAVVLMRWGVRAQQGAP